MALEAMIVIIGSSFCSRPRGGSSKSSMQPTSLPKPVGEVQPAFPPRQHRGRPSNVQHRLPKRSRRPLPPQK